MEKARRTVDGFVKSDHTLLKGALMHPIYSLEQMPARVLPVVASDRGKSAVIQEQMPWFHGTNSELTRMFLYWERRPVMRIHPTSRVFTAPAEKVSLGWSRLTSPSDRATKRRSNKISIAWWLLPSLAVYLVIGWLVFG